MTRYRSVVITDNSIQIVEHEDIESSEGFEYKMMEDSATDYASFGDLNGTSYTVVYYRRGGHDTEI